MLDALGIQESPALSQIRSWLQDFAARHDNVALTTPALDTVISLMSLLAGCHPSTAEVAGLRGPDVFARLEKLFIDDVPWLKSRLDLSFRTSMIVWQPSLWRFILLDCRPLLMRS